MSEYSMLFPELLLLTLSFLLFVGTILYFRLYRSSLCMFFFLITVVLFTPALFYMFIPNASYIRFSVKAFQLYMFLSAVSFLAYSLILTCLQGINFSHKISRISRWGIPYHVRTCSLYLFFAVIFLILVFFLIRYAKYLPLFEAIFANKRVSRPDATGSIPHWFTFSCLLCIVPPCFYLFYYEKKHPSKAINLALICITAVFMVAGGNKGFLAFWFLFLWVYVWDMKIDVRIIVAAAVAFMLVPVLMLGMRDLFSMDTISWAVNYGLSRLFLTTGAMLINRIEMILQGFPFSNNNQEISKQVFLYVYERDGGSAPTYFMGNLLVKHGFLAGFLMHLTVFILLAAIARRLDSQKTPLYKIWLFYLIQYFLGVAPFSMSFLYRFCLIVALYLVFQLLNGDVETSSTAGAASASPQRFSIACDQIEMQHLQRVHQQNRRFGTRIIMNRLKH